MVFLAALNAFLLGIISLTALLNAVTFPRLRRGKRTPDAPLVSLLVPARNEERVIGHSVRRLLEQTYPHLELIVLDDDSEDGTADVARSAAAGDPRFRILAGAPLPAGWLGKNWACEQLGRAARGELLVFTDADVIWRPEALSGLVAQINRTRSDLLTVWPTQITRTWAERLTVPNIALAIMAYLPVVGVHHLPFSLFAAANGQCVAFRRAAYAAIGGHAAVRDQIVEDVAFARRTKQRRLRLRMVDGNGLIACRMYESWPEVRDGLAKNIRAGHGGTLPLIASTLFHWLLFVVPWVMALLAGRHSGEARRLWLGLGFGGMGVRAFTAAVTRQRPQDALLMPLSVALFTRIAARSIRWHRRGRTVWKGRTVVQDGALREEAT